MLSFMKSRSLKGVGALILSIGATGCSQSDGGGSAPLASEEHQVTVVTANPLTPAQQSAAAKPKAPVDLNKMLPHNAICTPWPDGESGDWRNGLKASVHYRAQGQPRWYTAGEYITKGTPKSGTVYVSALNVPTRMFSEGFQTASGEPVKDEQGTKLIEYFGLDFESDLALLDTDEEGDYEFSVLADDGTLVSIQDGTGTWKTVINNDGDHPTKMGCATERVRLEKRKLYPIRVKYYQGPRYHISLMLMWRKAPVGPVALDPLCNQEGNDRYFDPDHASAVKPAYQALLSRGWKPIPSPNFLLSAYDTFNICNPTAGPEITEFMLSEFSGSDFTFLWETNEPATTQLKITNLGTQESFVTQTNNELETLHFATVSGLNAASTYLIQPVSLNENLGLTVGAGLVIKTR